MSLLKVDRKNFAISIGNHKEITITVTDSAGLEDLTGGTLAFYMVDYQGQTTPVIEKTSADSAEFEILTQAGATLGQATLKLLPADTSSVEGKRYWYKIVYTSAAAKVRDILIGFFYVTTAIAVHVDMVRGRLQEAGDILEMYEDAEFRPVIGTDFVRPKNPNIISVQGVWASNDTDKSGDNYFENGGTFDPKSGLITLGSTKPAAYSVVIVDYTWSSGLTDDVLLEQLEANRLFCVGYTGIEFFFGSADTVSKQQVEEMTLARTIISAVWIMNSPNSAQLGYNFRIDEFEFQSKLWGEGMIAQALFMEYKAHYEEWKQIIGKDIKTTLAPKITPNYTLTNAITQKSNDGLG